MLRNAIEQMIDAFARFHAAWWNHPRLGQDIGVYPEPAAAPSATRRGMDTLDDFAVFLGDRLSLEARSLYERVRAAYATLAHRATARNQFTLTHGDAHFGNVLLPKDLIRDHVRIIDWDVWGIALGVNDIAELLAQPWYAGPKTQREQELLRHYYRQLVWHGVTGYTWEECWNDYRFAVINQLFVSIQQWADQQWPGFWWGRVERSLHTFRELNCAELLA